MSSKIENSHVFYMHKKPPLPTVFLLHAINLLMFFILISINLALSLFALFSNRLD